MFPIRFRLIVWKEEAAKAVSFSRIFLVDWILFGINFVFLLNCIISVWISTSWHSYFHISQGLLTWMSCSYPTVTLLILVFLIWKVFYSWCHVDAPINSAALSLILFICVFVVDAHTYLKKYLIYNSKNRMVTTTYIITMIERKSNFDESLPSELTLYSCSNNSCSF